MKLFKKSIDPNLLIAVGVLIASFSALFVYMRQASIMSEQTEILLKQTKANSWPHLDLSFSYNNPKEIEYKRFSLSVVNKGIGPAIIQNVTISYNDMNIKNWNELYTELKIPDSVLQSGHAYSSVSNKVVSPNESIQFVDWSGNKELMRILRKNAGKIKVSICYKSVFDEFWKVERTGFDGVTKEIVYSRPETCSSSGTSFED
ncbi:hypothetical protein [Aquimarina sp. 2201CG5-10]|uniref:hypothetical protein n=1 Tax=Aquimarina callyspongiae TaxID=3098150 RepID=UPI002AB401A5|nr:hypothetical protein [Aquimarina sp. 2201CG5-10]MDY8135021.1 hypothetical protein [Aquimarina sp. 2201CG5-10]